MVEPVAQQRPPATTTDSDRQRQQRRISASRLTSIEPQPSSSGLLKRVSAAFSGRAEKLRLDELEAERRNALVEAGRRSLADGTALGLPTEILATLSRGQAVSLRPEQCKTLTNWREDRKRLVRFDAEIAALRQALGLGADPDAVILISPTLHSDELVKIDRAFATMDAVGTRELDHTADAGIPIKRAPPRHG